MKNTLIFCYGAFLIGTMLSLAISGSWISTSDINILNTITSLSGESIQVLQGIPVIGPTVAFFQGLFQMLTWNYPYLNNAWGFIIQLDLYAVSFGVVWGIIEMFQGVWQGLAGL